MLALIAIAAAARLAVQSATIPPSKIEPAEEPSGADPTPDPALPDGSRVLERVGSAPLPRSLVAGLPRIVEDLSYDEIMSVAAEPAEPPNAPALKLAAGIAAAGVLFAGVMAAVAKGFDAVFGPLFKIFK